MYNPYDQYDQNINNFQSFNDPTIDNIQFERLLYETKENKRRINSLLRRIVRLENYLRIKDNGDSDLDI